MLHRHANGRSALDLYEPVNVLKPVAPDLWIVDGSEIRFGLGWLKFPFSTRMTVFRLRSGELVLHSPVCIFPRASISHRDIGANSLPGCAEFAPLLVGA